MAVIIAEVKHRHIDMAHGKIDVCKKEALDWSYSTLAATDIMQLGLAVQMSSRQFR